jgi:hypothetical protein
MPALLLGVHGPHHDRWGWRDTGIPTAAGTTGRLTQSTNLAPVTSRSFRHIKADERFEVRNLDFCQVSQWISLGIWTAGDTDGRQCS